MKLTQSFLFAGAACTLALAPLAWADRGPGRETAAEPAVEEPSIDEPVIDEPTDEGNVEDGTVVSDPEVVVDDRTVDGEPVDKGEVSPDGEMVELTMVNDGEPVQPELLDRDGGEHVQRGGDAEMDPVIFQTMGPVANEGAPVGRNEAAFGSDERAADIQSKEARGSAVKNLKKGPVALVKKGRVFLR